MSSLNKALAGGALIASTLVGGALGAAYFTGVSGAQDTSSSTTAPATTQTAPPQGTAPAQGTPPAGRPDPSKGGHVANGITEELLTGDTASSVTAAAQAAVPDGTILRVENDAEGATYEAHVQKSDGSEVTVKLDASFNVTSIENGPR